MTIPSGPAADPCRTAATVDVDGLRLPAELVTGEAVVLDLRPASFATRALALLLDTVLYVGLWSVSSVLLFGAVLALDEAAAATLVLLVSLLFILVLPVTVETVTRGRSVGKYAAGLRVVRDDGGPIRFRQAFARGLLAILEIYTLPFIALLSSLMSRQGKRVGDLLAGSHVVRDRGGVALPPPVVMPPYLAGWAAAADIGRIPQRLALAARGYLGRLPTLHPQAQARLGVALADQVARYIAPMPPPGTAPEAFLAAVLAERTRRELARLTRADAERTARASRRDAAPVLSASSHRLVGDD